MVIYYNKKDNIVVEHEQLRQMVESSEYYNPVIVFKKMSLDGEINKITEEYIKNIPFSDHFQMIELNIGTNIRELDDNLIYTDNELVRNKIRDIMEKRRDLNYLKY